MLLTFFLPFHLMGLTEWPSPRYIILVNEKIPLIRLFRTSIAPYRTAPSSPIVTGGTGLNGMAR